MCSLYIPLSTRTKLDWFDDGVLKQTFDSYTHAAEVLKVHYGDNTINDNTVRNLVKNNGIVSKKSNSKYRKILVFKDKILVNTFNTNVEFANFYKLSLPYVCNIINGKYISPVFKNYIIKTVFNIPDIRFHIFEEVHTYKTCSYCEKPKPLTEENYTYINKKEKIFCNKCKSCTDNTIYSKNIDDFSNNLLNGNWKIHPEFTYLYFERDTINIFNEDSGKYIISERCLNNKTIMLRNLKWEAFYGKIPENKIVKFKKVDKYKNNEGIELDNLECVYVYCDTCQNMIEKPKSMNHMYCSKKCQNVAMRVLGKKNLRRYMGYKLSTHKFTNKKYNTVVDYDIDYLISLGLNCCYCNTECNFGYSLNSYHPDTLSYDKKNSEIGYIKDNIVVCCWFCNRMKNQTKYKDWVDFIDFIKNAENTELDLSCKNFAKTCNKINIQNIYWHITKKSPKYYETQLVAKTLFKTICLSQSHVDPYFNFFPIIYLESNCLFNASIDAIDTSLPEEEKHRPANLQVVPKCFNYGKNILSNADFLKEWIKRGFKTDFSKCTVKLPENYLSESYFHHFIYLKK